MSLSDDEEALFDDIYGDDDTKKEETKLEESKEETKEKDVSSEDKKDNAEDKEAKEEVKEEENVKSEESKSETTEEKTNETITETKESTLSSEQPVASNNVEHSSGDSRKADLSRDAGKMFIGGLDWDTDEDRLKEYFSQYGEVIEHTIMREPSTGRSRGFGFLTFADKSSVDAVVRTQHVLDGKVIDPKRAIPREEQDKTGKIFVGGIPPEVRPHEFESFFAKFGTIIDAQLMLDKDTGRSRGFGFVTFDSPDAVDKVCQGKYIQFGNRQIEVKRAEPRGPQQQQNHIAAQQQRYLQQHQQHDGGNNFAANGNQMYAGMPGVTPEQMTEYYQRMTQYWSQLQQQGGAVAQMAQMAQAMQQQMAAGQTFPMPNVPLVDGNNSGNSNNNSNPNNETSDIPRGPRNQHGRGGYRGGNGYRGGRGGYNRRGGYHPYSRN